MKCFWKFKKKKKKKRTKIDRFGDFFTIKDFWIVVGPQNSTNQLKIYFLCAK